MIRFAFLSIALSISTASYSQNQEPYKGEMENSLAPYLTLDMSRSASGSKISSLRQDPNSVESQILRSHNRTIPQSSSVRSESVRRKLENIADTAMGNVRGYRRITCSNSSCEIVVVVPEVPNNGSQAKEIVDRFYNGVLVNDVSFTTVGPSMIIEGSNTKKGFSILHFVDLI